MYRKEIEQYIDSHKEEMLKDIITLCKINSERGEAKEGKPFGEGPYEALMVALRLLEEHGFAVKNYDNYVGTADLNDKESHLDILAHLDVVPAGEGWSVTQPFMPVVRDGKIYGRGTADDKGPAMAAVYAMKAVRDLGIPLKKNVRLILGTDEECGSSDIEHYYAVEKEAPMTFSPDGVYPVMNIEKGALRGEFQTNFPACETLPRLTSFEAGVKVNIVPGKAYAVIEGMNLEVIEGACKEWEEKSNLRFEVTKEGNLTKVTAIGKGAHASIPEEGNNALTGLLSLMTQLPFSNSPQMEMIRKLVALMPHGDVYGEALGVKMSDELSGDLTLAFSILSITPTGFEGMFDSRCPICSNEDNTLNVVKRRMEECGITFLTDSMRAPHHVDGNSHFVQTLLSVYEEYTGRKGECMSMGGGTYVHDLKNGVAFGAAMPGTDNCMHGADEFAVVDELILSAKMFAQIIVNLCSQ